ncbi:E3 ubiquitin-protein ligase MGRN1 isoform X5 [Heterocephalus glaber]|uniref:E3 ubiquitin-protein ligase n=1 Tax=Heterocephalus glaber TaxID=10181 RepID=A0AAX6RU51_HETGA|nr:E3 ubiquitin-protein ligase MGRN1 isoform X5 [Heterocephalus glaber]
MGSILSRRIAGVEDIDIQANSAYRYPPKSGNYFASHFFMGGEKFDTPHPEGYLFGENMDLNFLGSRPVQFPYVTPAPHEPVKTLRSLVNIRKDSLRLVRYKDDADSPIEGSEKPRVLYSLEFTFDADARVAITIYCQAVEEFLNGMAVYSPKSPALQSETIHYKRGVSQHFSLPSFKIDFSEWKDDELNFDLDRGIFPVVIQAVVDEGDARGRQLLCEAVKAEADCGPSQLPTAGDLWHREQEQPGDQAFRALLQIRAVRKKPGAVSPISFSPVLAQSMDHDEHSSSDSIPPGYEPISLLEALNGLRAVSPAIPSAPLYEEITYSGVSDGLSQASCPLAGIDQVLETSHQSRQRSKSPDSTLLSPSSPIHEEDEEKLSEDLEVPPPPGAPELALGESSSPESFLTEEVDEPSLKQGSQVASIEEVLQDGSPEHQAYAQSGPPADICLPGWPTSMESPHSLSTAGPPWPPLGGSSPDPGTSDLTPL